MTVLYRTYRPSKWDEVVGQDHIVNALKDSIANGRIAHAYLFSGTRGTGKTSIARILAKAVKSADEDIYEIDAASNRGIDNIRELREHVAAMPFGSQYKVYIIDEVHMLSKDAWNALLKTLEEPPKHVIFVLATTELDKVPDTIVSRCQTFSFKRPTREMLRKEVERIGKKEGYTIDSGASDLIALLGDGSFRDTFGNLEKVISSSKDKKITREEAERITGAPKAELVNKFIEAVTSKDSDSALRSIGTASKAGISMATYSALILEKMRFIMLLSYSPSSKNDIKERVSPDDMEFVEKLAQKKAVSPAILTIFLESMDAVGRSSIQELPLEMAVAKVASL